MSPEAIISVANRLSRNPVMQQIAMDVTYEIPMRHRFLEGQVQVMGASRMDPSRKPRTATTRIVPPGR